MPRLGIRALLRTLPLLTASSALTALSLHALTSARPHPRPVVDLGDLIELVAWCGLLGAGGWAAVLFATMLATALTGYALPVPCPRSWRPGVAALCGIGAAVGMALPAGAAQPPQTHPGRSTQASSTTAPSTATLPALGRPTGSEQTGHAEDIVVTAGESLWTIVAARHPHEPIAVTARRVARLHQANMDTIGPDADLIRPGQRLRPDDRDPVTEPSATARREASR